MTRFPVSENADSLATELDGLARTTQVTFSIDGNDKALTFHHYSTSIVPSNVAVALIKRCNSFLYVTSGCPFVLPK